MTLRILFLSSTVTGGSGKSQRQLATRLSSLGHEVSFLVDDNSPKTIQRKVYEKLTDLEVKVAGSLADPSVRWLASRMSTKPRQATIEGTTMATSYAPENALPQILTGFDPDVVVGSSIDRVTWRKITAHCTSRNIPTVLYLREEAALGHLTVTKLRPDLLLANAESIAGRARALGYACDMVPSVVELNAVRTTSTREVALLINPIQSHGVDLCLELGALHPAVTFVLQESWILSSTERAAMETRLAGLSNVEFRARTDTPGEIYRDARVLLVPHRIDNRPRVIAEAQHNGIPVLASDQPGLIEAVGPGGITLPVDDVSTWSRSLTEIFTNASLEQRLGADAREHARRPELDPNWVTARFVELLKSALTPGLPT